VQGRRRADERGRTMKLPSSLYRSGLLRETLKRQKGDWCISVSPTLP
jgi:hypothetical protein